MPGRPAGRPARGKRLTVGLLHNCKPNGDTIVQTAYAALVKQGIAGDAVFQVKHTAGEPMNAQVFEQLRRCDLVLNALSC